MPKILEKLFFWFGPIFSGILLALAFPPYDHAWLAWIGIVPFLLGVRGLKPWQAFLAGWLAGTACMTILFYWINEVETVNSLSSGLIFVYLGLYYGLFGAFFSAICQRIPLPFLSAGPIWVACEYLRANAGFLACPWGLLGHSQYLNLPMIQWAAYGGVFGVSLVIFLANAAVAELSIQAVNKMRLGKIGPSRSSAFSASVSLGVLLCVVFLWMVGSNSIEDELTGTPIKVAVVQGNINLNMKREPWKFKDQILSRYETLSRQAARSSPDLIVWPEAATPGFVLVEKALKKRIQSFVREMNTSFLIGSSEYPKFTKQRIDPDKSGNTALFFSPEGKLLDQYLKIRLVPFGEYVPYAEIIPWPSFIVPENKTLSIPGTELKLFELNSINFGVLICWENLFPDMPRKLVAKGADFIINISNEIYFGKTGAPHQILSMCVFRAVENRIHIVRSTNTGVSAFIDPYGRVTDRVMNAGEDLFVKGVSTREIKLSRPGTFYTRHGDVLALSSVAFSLYLFLWFCVKRAIRTSKREPQSQRGNA